jgi:hypothetical protein
MTRSRAAAAHHPHLTSTAPCTHKLRARPDLATAQLATDARSALGMDVAVPTVGVGERQMRGPGGSLDPPGPLPTHLPHRAYGVL